MFRYIASLAFIALVACDAPAPTPSAAPAAKPKAASTEPPNPNVESPLDAFNCKEGNFSACYSMGIDYLHGDGVTKHRPTAAFLFEYSCKNGLPRGCYNLALMYENGVGVDRKPDLAASFYDRACNGGINWGCERSDIVANLGSADWNGARNDLGRPTGRGQMTFTDGRVFDGEVSDLGTPTVAGVTTYPNGTVYKGGYDKGVPSGPGALMDASGAVIYAGDFQDGVPEGIGVSARNGTLTPVAFSEGSPVSANQVATNRVAQADKDAIDALHLSGNSTLARSIRADTQDIGTLRERITLLREEFQRQEADFPQQCHCTFNVCLSVDKQWDSSKESLDAFRARQAAGKAAGDRLDMACRAWRASGSTKAERQAVFDKRLRDINQDIELTQKSRLRDMASLDQARVAKERELQATRASRTAQAQKQVERERSTALDTQKAICEAQPNYCGCSAIRGRLTSTERYASCVTEMNSSAASAVRRLTGG
ncbi:MAG: hypothetical protein AAF092_06350 [Pseudomonadota bacterium]